MNSKIKDFRIDNDLTQEDIARILNCSLIAYSYYENGYREIPLELLNKLADYYNVSLDTLVGRKYPKKKQLYWC